MEDTIEEVLLRLPVKSLVRCKPLSKKWQNFISHNPSFRQRYISRIQDQGGDTTFMLGFFYSKNRVFRDVDQVRFLQTSAMPLPVPDETLSFTGHESLHIVGSSNGFLLSSVEELYPVNYLICNPINKQWHPLPKPNTTSKLVTHGFICHTSTPCLDQVDRYTIVRGIWHHYRVFDTNLTIEIFSSDSPSHTWKLLNLTLPFSIYLTTSHLPNSIVDEQGMIYMVCILDKESLPIASLIIFDQTVEDQQCLQLIEFPPERNDGYNAPFCFGQSNGLLLYAKHERHPSQLKIHMLTNYEDVLGTRRAWLLIHKISLDISMESIPQFVQNPNDKFEIKAFHPTNPQLLFLFIGGYLVLCDVSNSKLELVSDFSGHIWLSSYFFFPYTGGLIGPHLFLET